MENSLVVYIDKYRMDYSQNMVRFLNGKLHFCILKVHDFFSKMGYEPVDIHIIDYGAEENFYLIPVEMLSAHFKLTYFNKGEDNKEKPISLQTAKELFNRDYDFDAHRIIEVYLDDEKIDRFSKHTVVMENGIFKFSIAADVMNTAGYQTAVYVKGKRINNIKDPEKGDFIYKKGFTPIDVVYSFERHWNHYEFSYQELTNHFTVKLVLRYGYFQKEKTDISYEQLCEQFQKIATRELKE